MQPMKLTIKPISLKAANEYVAENHRHSKPTRGHKFSISVHNEHGLVGVAIIGRPVAQVLDNGTTAEILRVCTDGTPNACSKLYGASVKACKAMGYTKSGASLKASNFTPTGNVTARQWDTPSRPREQREALERTRWECN